MPAQKVVVEVVVRLEGGAPMVVGATAITVPESTSAATLSARSATASRVAKAHWAGLSKTARSKIGRKAAETRRRNAEKKG